MTFYCFENTDKTNRFDSDWFTRQRQDHGYSWWVLVLHLQFTRAHILCVLSPNLDFSPALLPSPTHEVEISRSGMLAQLAARSPCTLYSLWHCRTLVGGGLCCSWSAWSFLESRVSCATPPSLISILVRGGNLYVRHVGATLRGNLQCPCNVEGMPSDIKCTGLSDNIETPQRRFKLYKPGYHSSDSWCEPTVDSERWYVRRPLVHDTAPHPGTAWFWLKNIYGLFTEKTARLRIQTWNVRGKSEPY
jgi:hypothetical protein